MSKVWLISDTHFMHDKSYVFTDNLTGERIRPWANNAEEGDAIMIDNWHANIKPKDKVFHLGDVAIPRRGLKLLEGLPGRKVLLRGNHDIFKLKDYVPYFDDIVATHKVRNIIMSHYPIHPGSFEGWCIGNIHGHLHSNRVRDAMDTIDERYQNVCVEHTNAMPIELEEVMARFE